MDNDTVLSQLMTLWEHDFVKFDAPEEIRVISSGRQLDIFKTFRENKVENEQVLWLMKRILGGMGGLGRRKKDTAGGRNIIVDPKARAFAPNEDQEERKEKVKQRLRKKLSVQGPQDEAAASGGQHRPPRRRPPSEPGPFPWPRRARAPPRPPSAAA